MKKAGWVALLLVGVILLPAILVIAAAGGPSGEKDTCVEGEAPTGELKGVPEEWKDDLEAAAKEAELPTDIAAAQINQESKWDPDVGSSAGAQGLGQFIPETWETYGEGGDIHNPEDSLAAYGRYMKDLRKQVKPMAGGDDKKLVQLTLAAYNAGPGAVEQHNGIPPYEETENYVSIITKGSQTGFSTGCKAGKGTKSWDGDLGDGEWTTPLPNSEATGAGRFGPRNIPGMPAWANDHKGIDLATDQGSYSLGGPVVAPAPLEVLDIYEPDGCVQARLTGADDDPKFGMAFCHLGKIDVKKGDELDRGDILGTEGNQGENLGNSQGGKGFITHLHFEVYPPDAPESTMVIPGNDSAIDPEPLLKEKGAWP